MKAYGIDGKIIHTPGHTPGSISVILDSGEAFVGCMAHNGFPFRIQPGLPIYALDIEEIKKQWKILIDSGIKMIYPGHGKPFPVEIIKKSLGYLSGRRVIQKFSILNYRLMNNSLNAK